MAFNYNESEEVRRKRQAVDSATDRYEGSRSDYVSGKGWDRNSNPWAQQLTQVVNKIQNRQPFTYDLSGDMLYEQYKNQFMNLGDLAMQNTIGQASSLTGGYANSYAVTAGNQANQEYLKQLNEKIPDLYQLAMSRYEMEGKQMDDLYGILREQYGIDYGEHRDSVDDLKTLMDTDRGERDYALSDYRNERDFDYNEQHDQYTSEYQENKDAQAASAKSLQLLAGKGKGKGSGAGTGKGGDTTDGKTPVKENPRVDASMAAGYGDYTNPYAGYGPAEWETYAMNLAYDQGREKASKQIQYLISLGLVPENSRAAALNGLHLGRF